MKILIATDYFPPDKWGGAESIAHMHATGLIEAGHEVNIISTTQDINSTGLIKHNNIKIFKIYSNYHIRWRAWKSLNNKQVVTEFEKKLKETKPEIIHFHSINHHLSYKCLQIAKNYGAKVYFTAHDVMTFSYGKLWHEKFVHSDELEIRNQFDYKVTWLDNLKKAKKRYNPWRNSRIKKYLKYADKIITVSNALKEALKQNGIENTQTIHNGINITHWDKPIDINTIKQQFSITNKKVVLFAGRLNGAKGKDQILKTWKEVNKEVKDAVLLIVGTNHPDLKKTAPQQPFNKTQNNNKNIIFHPPVLREDLYKYYKISNVVIVPSASFDSFPTINLEAFACHKPVIATQYGGSREIVENNKSGYIVSPFDIKSMTKKIIKLLKNSTTAKQFGETGYNRVKKEFTLKNHINSLLKVYQEK